MKNKISCILAGALLLGAFPAHAQGVKTTLKISSKMEEILTKSVFRAQIAKSNLPSTLAEASSMGVKVNRSLEVTLKSLSMARTHAGTFADPSTGKMIDFVVLPRTTFFKKEGFSLPENTLGFMTPTGWKYYKPGEPLPQNFMEAVAAARPDLFRGIDTPAAIPQTFIIDPAFPSSNFPVKYTEINLLGKFLHKTRPLAGLPLYPGSSEIIYRIPKELTVVYHPLGRSPRVLNPQEDWLIYDTKKDKTRVFFDTFPYKKGQPNAIDLVPFGKARDNWVQNILNERRSSILARTKEEGLFDASAFIIEPPIWVRNPEIYFSPKFKTLTLREQFLARGGSLQYQYPEVLVQNVHQFYQGDGAIYTDEEICQNFLVYNLPTQIQVGNDVLNPEEYVVAYYEKTGTGKILSVQELQENLFYIPFSQSRRIYF